MASYLIGAGGDYFEFDLSRLVRIFEISPTEVAWLTETGQNVVARGTGFSVATINGAPVLSGSITDLEIFSASGGFLLRASDLRLPAADAANSFRLVQLLTQDDDVLAKVEGFPVRFWGGDGFDVVDYSAMSTAVGVSLGSGNNRTNTGAALGDSWPFIEGVIGSRFDDSLTGNTLANALSGGDGRDTLSGGGGNDTLDGGAGIDILDGGDGIDTVSYASATASVTVNLGNTALNGGQAAGETYTSVENVIGSGLGDSLIGDNNGNTLSGNGGDDAIFGLGGDDQINGDNGADQLNGGAGNDTVSGGAGDDTLVGETGVDRFDGGGGFDFVSYWNATGFVTVNLGDSRFNGGQASGESYVAIEGIFGSVFGDSLIGDNNGNVIFGGGGEDFIYGLSGNDVLKGDTGNDRLVGGFGVDTIDGGDGDDILTGEAGADRFVFGTRWGRDVITDYRIGVDQRLDLSEVVGLDSFSQLSIRATPHGAVISFGADTIQLNGVRASQLSSADFLI